MVEVPANRGPDLGSFGNPEHRRAEPPKHRKNRREESNKGAEMSETNRLPWPDPAAAAPGEPEAAAGPDLTGAAVHEVLAQVIPLRPHVEDDGDQYDDDEYDNDEEPHFSRWRWSQLVGSEAGMATAEYAIATLAAVGFAALLVAVLQSGEVRGMLMSIIERALSFG
jgi:Protein of unknown function (DUF4244)